MLTDNIFKFRFFFVVCLLAVALASPSQILARSVYSGGIVAESFDAPIVPLDNEKYFHLLREKIKGADRDIHLSMYLFKTTNSKKNYSNAIMQELLAAAQRGVEVEVILEKNGRKSDSLNKSNSFTADRLQKGGVKVRFDSLGKVTHSKLIVIDRKIVFIGSHNLSHTALSKSNETSLMIESEELARYFLDYLNRIE
ncbi:MAG: phospholipase [Nitrospinae bacterium]|nr:phospholipase [Nitrospinota bacterium]